MKRKNFVIVFFVIVSIASCKTSQTSMIIGDSYDEKNDVTSLMLFPYGNIDIPGEWVKTSYNESSKQHHFKNADSTAIAVTMNPISKYPFHNDTLTVKQWVDNFYKWDSEYYINQGYTSEILRANESDNFIVWKVIGNNVNTIFLYGYKNKYAINYAVFTSNLTDEERLNFLNQLYESN